MKILTILIISVACITGCASTKSNVDGYDGKPLKTAETEFLEEYGPLKLTYNEKGAWVSIDTSATAPITFDAAEGREVAFKIATMRAKRNLVEFMANDVKSTKSLKSISNSYVKSVAEQNSSTGKDYIDTDDEADSGATQSAKELRQKANTIASTLRENISDDAQAILKGVYVSGRKVSRDGKHVSVTVSVNSKSISLAHSLRLRMQGI